jgi:hypothetical protein
MSSNVLLRLGDPRAQRPGIAQVLNQVATQTRTVLRHKHNTGNVWNFNDLVVDVQPNLGVYAINQPDFGTPLAVVTYAPQLPTWIPRLIPFFGPQNLPYDWGLQNNAAAFFWSYDGSNCSAQRCAFYWKDNTPYIEFLPIPNLVASYKVKYLQNSNNTYDASLASSPAWSEDCDLIEVRSAIALLPLTEWMAPDSKEGRAFNAERRKDLAVSLSAEERELTRQFEAAALNFAGPRIYPRWSGSMAD